MRLAVTSAITCYIWYIQALRVYTQIRCGDVVNHVAAATLTAIVGAEGVIAIAVCRAVIVDQVAVVLQILLQVVRMRVGVH